MRIFLLLKSLWFTKWADAQFFMVMEMHYFQVIKRTLEKIKDKNRNFKSHENSNDVSFKHGDGESSGKGDEN